MREVVGMCRECGQINEHSDVCSLSRLEAIERTGYIEVVGIEGGGLISIQIASPGQVTYHFERKRELREKIAKQETDSDDR